ncbi:MAG TPA: PEP-utilizing enzyme, partial [Thermodesulfovibrionales bacterium]|nr:PEP-utilizing enzyme [Thermodesulfovibrionales bacterium]
EIRRLKEERSLPVILLRKAASTVDVSLMPLIDGILTSFGGVASHASVLAQKFNLTAIVGCPDMEIGTDEKGEPFAQIGRHPVREGSVISIDGSTGLVYSGSCPGAEEGEE